MVGDAFIDLVVTHGVDVTTLAHTSRKATREQLVALYAGGYECNVDGCDSRIRLEVDHLGDGWAKTKTTSFKDLTFKCEHHHDLKSHKHWTDGPKQANGKRKLHPPNSNAPPGETA